MKNLHIIATDKPSRLYLVKDKLKLSPLKFTNDEEVGWLTQNIYITSDEEIKEGDWFIFDNDIIQVKGEFHLKYIIKHGYKKIILTTDQDLITEGIQQIEDEFLEWFVKNPSCEEAMAYPVISHTKLGVNDYKIIIPKDEPKQEHCDCRRAYKEALSGICELCWDEKYPDEEETLEKAAYQARRNYQDEVGKDGMNDCIMFDAMKIQRGFELGAKWQAERMYSKEEVGEIAKDAYTMGRNNILIGIFNKWFEQFKKKEL